MTQQTPVLYETTLHPTPDPIIGSPVTLTYNGEQRNYLVIWTENQGIELAIASNSSLAEKTINDIKAGNKITIDAKGIYVRAIGEAGSYPVFIADTTASQETAQPSAHGQIQSTLNRIANHPVTESLVVTAGVLAENEILSRRKTLGTFRDLAILNLAAIYGSNNRRRQS